jgi:AcrR family transcriptional regulator
VSSTRDRILGAAREITEKQGAAPTMSALARTVGISRQAPYLHFPDRAQLLLALVADIDEKEQLQAGRAAVREAADAAGAIRAWARLHAEGRLDPTWPATEAAALLWELTSFRVWDDLVNDARIAPDRYVEIITAAALGALGAPVTPPPGLPDSR